MSDRKLSLLIALSILTFGCTLDDAHKYGEQCEGAKYYSDLTGTKIGSFEDDSDQYFEQYQRKPYCPEDYPVCSMDANNTTFCHKSCDGGYVYCQQGCIDPNSTEFCGAAGLCNDSTPGSKNFIGETCNDDKKCVEGKCTCSEDKTVVCNNVCINPNIDKEHCGAAGACSDDDPASINFKGTACDQGYSCKEGKCKIECPARQHGDENNESCVDNDADNCGEIGVKCNENENEICAVKIGKCVVHCDNTDAKCTTSGKEICVDPKIDTKFCGASLSDCSGYKTCIEESETCIDGECKCKNEYHQFNTSSDEGIICELNDNDNCGEHGVVCDFSKVEHSTQTECNPTSAICEATGCEMGYHVYNGQCEKDDNSNCGAHESTCTKADVVGSETVSCNTGQCLPLSCDSDHILLNNTSCIERDCQDGQIKCINNYEGDGDKDSGAIYVCSNRKWTKKDDCDNNNSCNSDSTECGVCKNDDTTCTNSNTMIGRVRTCINGAWSSPVSCTPHSCDAELKSCGICKNDVDTKCINDENDIGYIAICKDGNWFKDETMVEFEQPNGQTTSIMKSSCMNVSCKVNDKGKSVCGDCKNTTTAICKNDDNRRGQMIICSDGKISKTVCNKGHSCDSTGLACGTCTNSVMSCNDDTGVGQLSICDYGVDTILENCPGNTKCKTSTECEPCADGNKYFIGTDGVSCVTYSQLIADPSVGKIIYFGHYQKMNDVGDKHPIEWQILKVEDSRILLITRYVIDAIPYHIKSESGGSSEQLYVTWKESTLRSWLNGYSASNNNSSIDYTKDNFINTAFSDEDRKHIKSVTLSNADKDFGGEDTTDRIFLLSLSEVNSYLTAEDARIAIPTTYAKNVKNTYTDPKCTDGDNCPTLWLLRTPGKSLLQASYVFMTGEIDSDIGVGVSETGIGLRPAIWIGK